MRSSTANSQLPASGMASRATPIWRLTLRGLRQRHQRTNFHSVAASSRWMGRTVNGRAVRELHDRLQRRQIFAAGHHPDATPPAFRGSSTGAPALRLHGARWRKTVMTLQDWGANR
jgi:hypothetical protein